MSSRLLDRFASTFRGQQYIHRNSSLGDRIAVNLYEDLFAVGKSEKFVGRVKGASHVVNLKNARQGIKARRGDGTFGERLDTSPPFIEDGFQVPRGNIATIEIGAEVKILAKAMIKQIDRVIGDLVKQAEQFRTRGGSPICVGIVGINFADRYTSFERDRAYATDGKTYKHPIQEAEEAQDRIERQASQAFDELLILPFRARNEPPYDFEWVAARRVADDYAAILIRISRLYEKQ